MSKVFEHFGSELVNKAGEQLKTTDIRGEGKVIGVYFSAHWCPPCRNFTPKLAEFYKKVKASSNGDKFEIVFVSSDRNHDSFAEYLNEMPWWALPFDRRDEKGKLSKHFSVGGIPTLIFLDGATGKILNKNARAVVDSNLEMKNFPWKAKTLYDILKDGEYIDNKNEAKTFEQDIKGKVLGIYFSAHWCPPCKAFTPVLSSIYKAVNAETKKFEVVFVSSDQNEATFKEYFSEMPFLALPYDSEIKDELNEHFEIEGIPMLILVDGDGSVITTNGRSSLTSDKCGKKFPWKPEPVEELDEVSGPKLNEETCLVYFPGGDQESFEKMKEILKPIAKDTQTQAKQEETKQDICFLVATPTPSDIVRSLGDFIHVNVDEKALFILDISNTKIYKCEHQECTEEVVKGFVKSYRDGNLVGCNIDE